MEDPQRCFDSWAEGKSAQERIRLLDGLAELADRPLTELPGLRRQGFSPMIHWTVIGSTVVYVRVYEQSGCFDLDGLRDFNI